MRVSLTISPEPTQRASQAKTVAPPLLNPAGPSIIIGGRVEPDSLAQPIIPAHDTLFAPRGMALASAEGPLVVADTGHHRLLVWRNIPQSDHEPANIVIGQPDFSSEGRNAKGPVGPATLNVPTGIAIEKNVLAIADSWNHRVLIWTSLPTHNNHPADIVLGQADFESTDANRGGAPKADTLNWCYGVALIDDKLFVADTGNRRVLVWDELPEENGQPADRVLGQEGFDCRDENAGQEPGALGMRWPHGIARIDTSVLVSDAGNNRIMVWYDLPNSPGIPCDYVLGQKDMISLEHNRGQYWPNANAVNMPYAIATANDLLIAADTANSRLIGWRAGDLSQDAPATHLTGQPDFAAKGDNRWQAPMRDSLCWPYGLSMQGQLAAIADSGNNRVLLWEVAL